MIDIFCVSLLLGKPSLEMQFAQKISLFVMRIAKRNLSDFSCCVEHKRTVNEGTHNCAEVPPRNNLSICYGLGLNKRCRFGVLFVSFVLTLNRYNNSTSLSLCTYIITHFARTKSHLLSRKTDQHIVKKWATYSNIWATIKYLIKDETNKAYLGSVIQTGIKTFKNRLRG